MGDLSSTNTRKGGSGLQSAAVLGSSSPVRLLSVISIRYQVKVIGKEKISHSCKSDGGSALAVLARQQSQVADLNNGFLPFYKTSMLLLSLTYDIHFISEPNCRSSSCACLQSGLPPQKNELKWNN